MITIYTHLHKPEVENTKDYIVALDDINNIVDFLNLDTTKESLDRLTGNKSVDREEILKDFMTNILNYEYQKDKIFLCNANYRVDFYKQTSETNGIIVEVEGGGTINNNHAMKDYEKTQACFKASFLILIVPNNTIPTILRRYEYKFSNSDNYDNGIDGLFLIGY